MNFKIIEYNSWNELKAGITIDVCREDFFPYRRYIFRGQENADWWLISSFDRNFGHLSFQEKQDIENKFLNEFKRMCIEWEGNDNFNSYSDEQILTAGQHYGVPTRLLDWSYSIYIASFFAFSRKNTYDKSAIWVIDTSHEIWQGRYGVSIEKCKVKENERQKYQYGVFTRNNTVNNTLEEYLDNCAKNCNVEGALYKVVLPTMERGLVLHDLDMMGINFYSLFRGIEGCAKATVTKVLS